MNMQLLNEMVDRNQLSLGDILKCLTSHNTLTKKITCDYLSEKCLEEDDVGLMVANVLMKDLNDANPCIRASCIPTISCVSHIHEAAITAVQKSLCDSSAQVRRSAVTSCITLHQKIPHEFLEGGLIDELYTCIRDMDPIVVTQSIIALETILKNDGKIVINRNIVIYLLEKLPQFTECNLPYILHILQHYTPKSEEELFEIVSAIDVCFSAETPSVLLACIDLFLYLTKRHPKLKTDLLIAVKTSVCKILQQNVPELTFVFISYFLRANLELGEAFQNDYNYFLIRAKDPVYLQNKKLEIIPKIVTSSNYMNVLDELQPFCLNPECYGSAFECLKLIGNKLPVSLTRILDCIEHVLKSCNRVDDSISVVSLECFAMLHLSHDQLQVSSALLELLSHHITKPSLQKEHLKLVLIIINLIGDKFEDFADIVEDLGRQNRTELSDEEMQLLLNACLSLFTSHPARAQPLLSHLLSQAALSGEAQMNHAAFVYSTLEQFTSMTNS